MHSRRTKYLAISLLAGGTLGMFTAHEPYGWMGLALNAAGIPLIICHTIRAAHVEDADRINAAHRDGYRLALDHVARGLLDPPAEPQPGPGEPLDTTNLIMLPRRADADDGHHRKAQ